MSSWKTTVAGVGMILTGLGGIAASVSGQSDADLTLSIGLIVGGVGMLLAKDD
jgi:hypothetical protein